MKKSLLLLTTILLFSFMKSNSQTAGWSLLTSGTTSGLYAVSAPSATVCYVAGAAGIMLKTINGLSWTPQLSGTNQDISCVYFIDINTGFAVGNGGAVVRTTNGGTNWTVVNIGTTDALRHVQFVNATTGYISGGASGSYGSIYKTTDGGTNWTSLNISAPNVIYSTYFTSTLVGYALEYSGKIYKTTDGGNSWSSAVVSGSASVAGTICFNSVTDGCFADLSGGIRRTTDAGASWNGVLSGTNDALQGVDLYDSNNGVIVGGNIANNTGTILTTTNGGASWTVYTPGCARLARVDFVNANTGYAVGLNGTILKYSSNVGVSEFNDFKAETYLSNPNPFETSTVIDCSKYILKDKARVEVYDVTGKLIIKSESTSNGKFLIERGNIDNGLYFYKIYDGKTIIGTGKMVAQ